MVDQIVGSSGIEEAYQVSQSQGRLARMRQVVAAEGNWAAAVGRKRAVGHRVAGTEDRSQYLEEGHIAFAPADSQASLGSWTN